MLKKEWVVKLKPDYFLNMPMRIIKASLIIAGSLVWVACNLRANEVTLYKNDDPQLKTAIFAGGCFWCMEPPFEKLDGVKEVFSGYTGGKIAAPTYKQVAYGKTTHREAVLVLYDPKKIKYTALLEVFWRQINPTQANGQFVDIGPHYSSAIYATKAQKPLAAKSKENLIKTKKFSKPIVTPILDAEKFWLAEEYHQDYYKKSPANYYRYRMGSGRDDFLEQTWQKPK